MVDRVDAVVYLRLAEKAKHLRELGMSDGAIARALRVSDKTIAKALRPLSVHAPLEEGRSS